MALSKRLKCIADYVVPGSVVADIGTDHGYIPIWLITNNICEYAYASDIREGPLKTAVENAKNYNVEDKICFRLCAGLDKYSEADADTIIIAGMGGETIIEILSASLWTIDKTLIIQPQSKISELRSWLNNNGYDVVDASLVDDAGRIYVVWKIQAGHSKTLSVIQSYIDEHLMGKDMKLLKAYTDELIKKTRYKISGMEKSSKTDEVELKKYYEALNGFIAIREVISDA